MLWVQRAVIDYDAAIAIINLMGDCGSQPPEALVPMTGHEPQGLYSNVIVSILTSARVEKHSAPVLDYRTAFTASLGLAVWMNIFRQWHEVAAMIEVAGQSIGSIQLQSGPGKAQSI